MKNFKNKTLVRIAISVLLSISIVSACSSGNPTTPNQQTLTNLAKQPSATTETSVKDISLSGRVIDSITRKPIEKATVLVYVISNDNILKAVKAGVKNIEPEKPSNPSDSTPASPSLTTTPAPVSAETAKPEATDVNKPSVNVGNPATEDEEITIKPKVIPSRPPIIKPPVKPVGVNTPKAPTTLTKSPEAPIAPSVAPSTAESSEASTAPTEENKAGDNKKFGIEGSINKDIDITSALSQLKANDIKEYKTTTGNDGKYWLNKIPDSNIVVSVSSPNYRNASVFALDTSKVEDIALIPLDTSEYYTNVRGSVLSTVSDIPVENAVISSSYVIGDDELGIPAVSDGMGEFNLNNVNIGQRTLLASVKGSSGKIISMGFLNKKIDKGEFEKVGSKDAPIIKLKSVTKYLDFKGILDLPDSTKLKSVNVYISFKKKDVLKEEVFFTEEEVELQKGSFELNLPELAKGFSYNLEFVGMDKSGFYSYYYLDNLSKENTDIKVNFMSTPFKGNVNFINLDDSNLPVFSWAPVEGANYYKVTLDKVDLNDNVVTIWEGITPFSTAIYPITTGLTMDKTKVKSYNWSVSAISESSNKTPLEKLQFSKQNILSWMYLSNSPVMNFSLDNTKEEEDIEIDTDNDKVD